MRKKTMGRKGFTLTEMLIVVLIIGLMTAAGAVGIGIVMGTRIGMIQAADAEILGSTAFQAVANELRFGQNIQVDASGESVVLDSMTYGPSTTISLDGETGRLKFGDEEGDQILGQSAYSGLTITNLKFDVETNGSIKITLGVSGNSGELWSSEDYDTYVVPLNGAPPAAEPTETD